MVADEESNNNVFHSNIVMNAEMDLTFEDETSSGNAFTNNKKVVSFDTLENSDNNKGQNNKDKWNNDY